MLDLNIFFLSKPFKIKSKCWKDIPTPSRCRVIFCCNPTVQSQKAQSLKELKFISAKQWIDAQDKKGVWRLGRIKRIFGKIYVPINNRHSLFAH